MLYSLEKTAHPRCRFHTCVLASQAAGPSGLETRPARGGYVGALPTTRRCAMIDQETRRKMRIIGVPEALDIMDAMAADPRTPTWASTRGVRHRRLRCAEKENASVKRLLQRGALPHSERGCERRRHDGRPLSATPSTASGVPVRGIGNRRHRGRLHRNRQDLPRLLDPRQACKHCLSTLYVRMPDLLMSARDGIQPPASPNRRC